MTVLLENLLLPIRPYLDDPTITDISINCPGQIWLDNGSFSQCKIIPELTLSHCHALIHQVATFSEQKINEQQPLLSAHLPSGERVQMVHNPATLWIDEQNQPRSSVALSIRKRYVNKMKLEEYKTQGGFNQIYDQGKKVDHTAILNNLLQQNQYEQLLRYAVLHQQTILISGATYSGKTSFLNMLLQEIPQHERIITIEDVPELYLPHPNRVRLFYSRGAQGRSHIQAAELVLATLRMRPDRIILGELRGDDAVHWLTAANSGHPGTLATIHADEPQMALEKLTLMVMSHLHGLSREEIYRYVTQIVDIVVQLKRDIHGKRYVSEILMTKNPKSPLPLRERSTRSGG